MKTACMPSVSYKDEYLLVFRDVVAADTLWRKVRARLGRPVRVDIEVTKAMSPLDVADAINLSYEMVGVVPEVYLKVDW